jgi:hypothetical protein
MNIARYLNGAITISVGVGLLLVRRRNASKDSADVPESKQRSARTKGMPQFLIVMGCLLLVIHSVPPNAMVSEPPASAWQTCTSSDGVLQFSLPGKPTSQTKQTQGELGRIKRVDWSLGIDNDEVIFGVDEIHYLNEDIEFDTKKYINAVVEAVLSKSQTTQFRDHDVSLGPYEGREVAIRSTKGYVSFMKIFLFNKCLYQLRITLPDAAIESPMVRRYLDSIELERDRNNDEPHKRR